MKNRKGGKIVLAILCLVMLCGCLAGCNQAERVSHNLSQEADNFNIVRRLVAFNQRTGEVVFIATGNFSIQGGGGVGKELEIIGEDDDGYYKHFIYLSSEMGYTIEQIESKNVSRYKFTINYNPNYLIPFDLEYIE